jgi:hypothetical protein
MDNIEIRSATVSINLDNPNDIDTKNREQMALDHIRNEYEGRCFDQCYVVRIISVMCGYRECLPRKMRGEATMSVHFEYEALSLSNHDGTTIVHNMVVKRVTQEIYLTCTSQSHITASVLVDTPGIIIPGMIIPIRLYNARFPQNVSNTINIQGELLKPIQFLTEFNVHAPTKNDITTALAAIENIEELASDVATQSRAQYFRAWLYPHNEITKHSHLRDLLEKKWTKLTSIVIDDYCDPTNLEFKKIKIKRGGINTISFSTFVTMLIDEAARMWRDIEKLSITYGSEEMFKKHSAIFKYYEGNKDIESDSDDDDVKTGGYDSEHAADESLIL